jgi:PAS domain S-box-containing protein
MANRIQLLYVDDEDLLLELGKEYFERDGEFSVDTAVSAREALDLLGKKTYDAIVSDYQMPGMDGIEFLKMVRGKDKTTPFILFTGRSREAIVIEALNSGADFYLQKGRDTTTFFTELRHVVRLVVLNRRDKATIAEQEQRFHDLQNASDLIQSVTPDGHFQFVNKKWQDTLGYGDDDLPHLTLFDIIHEDSQEHCRSLFPHVLAGENVGMIDVVFRTRDGKKVYTEGFASCKLIDGNPLYTRGIFRDVTDRRQMEAALEENRDYLNQIFSAVQSGIVLIDAATHEIIDLNPAAAAMMGTKKEEIVGKICHRFICPAELGRCPITDLHQDVDNSERVLLTASGKKLDIIKYVVPFSYHGRACLLETFLDNTERKRAADELHSANDKLVAAEEELRQNYDELKQREQDQSESEERYRSLFEKASEGILVSDLETRRFIHANPAICRMLGYTREELQGMQVENIHPKEDLVRVMGEFLGIARGETEQVADIPCRKKDGTVIYADIVGSLGIIDGKKCNIGFFTDITGRRQAELSIWQANKKLSLLYSITRHDINNQLLIMSGFVGLLQEKTRDPEFQNYFSRIMHASDQITAMIRFTKEYEQIGIKLPVWQNLRSLVESAGSNITFGKITLKNDLPPDAEAFADPLIIKVFFNLMDNALRHGGKITTLRFTLELRNGDCTIVCEDNGDGIDHGIKPKIFDRGFGKNTGFGLFISREILDITSITIRENGEPGKGARFEIQMPKGGCRHNNSS